MMTREAAVSRVSDAIDAEEPRHFHVDLVGDFIEGTPYTADALTVMDAVEQMERLRQSSHDSRGGRPVSVGQLNSCPRIRRFVLVDTCGRPTTRNQRLIR